MQINKIRVAQCKSFVKSQNIVKKTLPVVGSLSVLAGSSMGSTIDPGIPHVPGTSINDPFIDQIGHRVDLILDTGSAIGEAAVNGISSLGYVAIDAGCAIADGASDLGHQAMDALDKILDVIG